MGRFDVALGKPAAPKKLTPLTEENICDLKKGDRLIVSVDWWSAGFVFKEGATAVVNEVVPKAPYETSVNDLPAFAIELKASEHFGALGKFTANNLIKHFMLEN